MKENKKVPGKRQTVSDTAKEGNMKIQGSAPPPAPVQGQMQE